MDAKINSKTFIKNDNYSISQRENGKQNDTRDFQHSCIVVLFVISDSQIAGK